MGGQRELRLDALINISVERLRQGRRGLFEIFHVAIGIVLNVAGGALAALLHDMGYPPPAGRLVFIVGRVAGIAAEVAEEHAREKAMRIRIPVVYDGEPPRSL